MLEAFSQKNPGRSIGGLVFYEFCYFCVRLFITVFYRFQVWGSHKVPPTGPVLLISNHQSHFDPIIAGMSVPTRHLNFVARATLFKFKPFGKLIEGLNSIPLKQGESDTAAIRLTLEYLKQGRVMLVFPEGSRTQDGAVHEFKRGAWLLMSRAKCPILPIGIDGCFDAFPRKSAWPQLFGKRIGATVGEPIPAERLLAMSSEEGLAYLKGVVEDLRCQTAVRLARAGYQVGSIPADQAYLDDDGQPIAQPGAQPTAKPV